MHEGDWSDIEHRMRRAIADTGEFYHLLDFSEFVYLAKIAKGRATHFDSLLIQRCRHFAETGTVHSRVRIAPQPPQTAAK
jgi:hypothetical protein